MTNYHHLELLLRLHVQDLEREAAHAALIHEAQRAPRPSYRAQLSRQLLTVANRLDPSCAPLTRLSTASR